MKTLFASPETWRKMEALALVQGNISGRSARHTPDGTWFDVKDETLINLSRRAWPGEALYDTLARVINQAYGEMQ